MWISGVMPVHNEEAYLPFSLTSLRESSVDELVVVLDRCTDRSENIINRFAETVPFSVRVVKVGERRWFYPTAEVFRLGFNMAEGDVIYSLAADCLYDPKIFTIDWSDLDVASFHYFGYALHRPLPTKLHTQWINFYRFLLNVLYPKLTKKPKLSGIYAFKKHVLEEIQIPDVFSEDIWFLRQALKHKFRYKYFSNFRNVHLRPGIGMRKQKDHGVGKAKLGYPLWKVIAHSVLLWKPWTFKAYLSAKNAEP